jgi:hypothetical protein
VSDVLLIARALNFSAKRHAKQKRKGDAQEPYVNHLAEVAELVATATEGRDANLVAAAVLHDTVEDTATLPGELASIFNADVAGLVAEVTDDKRLDKAERKKLQVEHAAAIGARAPRFSNWRIKRRICARWPRAPRPAGAWNADATISPGPMPWHRDCVAPIPGSKHDSMKRRSCLNGRCGEALRHCSSCCSTISSLLRRRLLIKTGRLRFEFQLSRVVANNADFTFGEPVRRLRFDFQRECHLRALSTLQLHNDSI